MRSQETFYITCLFQDYCVYSCIYISTLSSNCTQMQLAHLSTLGPNISWIGEVCYTLNTTSLTSLVDNHWPTAGLRVISPFLKAGIGSNPLFLPEGITILPSSPSAGCEKSINQKRKIREKAVKSFKNSRDQLKKNVSSVNSKN